MRKQHVKAGAAEMPDAPMADQHEMAGAVSSDLIGSV